MVCIYFFELHSILSNAKNRYCLSLSVWTHKYHTQTSRLIRLHCRPCACASHRAQRQCVPHQQQPQQQRLAALTLSQRHRLALSWSTPAHTKRTQNNNNAFRLIQTLDTDKFTASSKLLAPPAWHPPPRRPRAAPALPPAPPAATCS